MAGRDTNETHRRDANEMHRVLAWRLRNIVTAEEHQRIEERRAARLARRTLDVVRAEHRDRRTAINRTIVMKRHSNWELNVKASVETSEKRAPIARQVFPGCCVPLRGLVAMSVLGANVVR